MISKENARLTMLAAALIFISTIVVLAARQMNLGPTRPAPDYRVFGPADAPIQIYEYTDLACPACSYAAVIIKDLNKIYDGKMRLSFKHFPLSTIHPWSLKAAAYADCAGAQGKFHDYTTMLFETQEAWALAKTEPSVFQDYAVKLKLDWPAMQACAASPETQKRVTLDTAEGHLKGVSATPTFFINGKRVVGGGQLLDAAKNFDNLLKAGK